MASQELQAKPTSSLLDLPDACLQAVLQCCTADPRILFNAARAHSRLHQASALVLDSITAVVPHPYHLKSVRLYLEKHAEHISSINLRLCKQEEEPFPAVTMRHLPPLLRLSSLQVNSITLQLQRGRGFKGVLGAAAKFTALKQLQLTKCRLMDGSNGLLAALQKLPAGLQHLSITEVTGPRMDAVFVQTSVLQRLQQLTYLELAAVKLRGPDEASPVLQPLQALTRLVDLRVDAEVAGRAASSITASMLSGTQHLTRLQLSHCEAEPGVLAGKTRLQHLAMVNPWDYMWDWAHMVMMTLPPLLPHLQSLNELTHLTLRESERSPLHRHIAPAAAYSVLSACSKLQYLDLHHCTFPETVWPHLFPTNKQLPHLRHLNMSCVENPDGTLMTAPEGTRLVSCCPGLQSLNIVYWCYHPHLLIDLQGLSGLQTLCVFVVEDDDTSQVAEEFQALCQLTRLRDLQLGVSERGEGVAAALLQLTQLKQLTKLLYCGPLAGGTEEDCRKGVTFAAEAPGDEAVWRQLQRHLLGHCGPPMAQLIAAAATTHAECAGGSAPQQ